MLSLYPPLLLFILSAPIQPPYPQSPLFHLAIELPSTNPPIFASTLLACHFYLHLSSFHPAFSSFPITLLSTPLPYSLRCLSPSVLPPCLVSFHFLPPWLAFPPSNPQPISLNLFFLGCLHLPLHSFPQFILAHFSWFETHLPPLFSLHLILSLFCCWVQDVITAFFFGLLLYEGLQGH